uniref:Uncharacterized protein n=1 Tax=Panagrolaimus superbus TaxID=310955 RepID=A0A914YXX5_9BILA
MKVILIFMCYKAKSCSALGYVGKCGNDQNDSLHRIRVAGYIFNITSGECSNFGYSKCFSSIMPVIPASILGKSKDVVQSIINAIDAGVQCINKAESGALATGNSRVDVVS